MLVSLVLVLAMKMFCVEIEYYTISFVVLSIVFGGLTSLTDPGIVDVHDPIKPDVPELTCPIMRDCPFYEKNRFCETCGDPKNGGDFY